MTTDLSEIVYIADECGCEEICHQEESKMVSFSKGNIRINVYYIMWLGAAALTKLNNSALTVQRWRKTAVIGWCGK